MGYSISVGRENNSGGGSTTSTLTSVRVTDIILDENHPRWKELGGWDSLGTIFYTGVIETTSTKRPDYNNVARPLNPNVKQYPLKNEIVIILKGINRDIYDVGNGNDTYYLSNINIWSHQHHNALPTKASLKNTSTTQDYQSTENGIVRQAKDNNSEIDLGNYFKEQLDIKPLLPYEGDYIIEGRYGNSIRLGASVKDDVIPKNNKNDWSQGDEKIGSPITIIRNGQSKELDEKGWVPTIEDINRDDSSIYMTSNQKISSLAVASTNFQSYETEIKLPVDPLTQLTDSPLPEIKQPEPANYSSNNDLNEELTQQDNDSIPATPNVVQERPTTPTSTPTITTPTDSLSFFDEMVGSGQGKKEDFVEYNLIKEDTSISGTEGNDPEVENQDGDEDLTPNNEGTKKHEEEIIEVKKGTKNKRYPVTITNRNGKPVILQEPQYWNSLKNNIGPKNNRITKLIVHTTAGQRKADDAVSVMEYFLLSKKWSYGGYHHLIQNDGKVTQCYKDTKRTNGIGHAFCEEVIKSQFKSNFTNEMIHISWIGGADFIQGKNQMSKGQSITIVDIIKFYIKRYPGIKVYGHNQFANKSCPWFWVPKLMTELGLEKNRGLTNYNRYQSYKGAKYQKVAQQIAGGEYPLINI